ncbi:MAG: hypothetical protein IPJ51_06335 [Saprospiraceae bacterium]|jgi:hypothetical protein|nr:hypothetical protein [Saprospiraceae bacterium]MBP6237579.1 hypothetical protein [Saprospiraceae bacterium]
MRKKNIVPETLKNIQVIDLEFRSDRDKSDSTVNTRYMNSSFTENNGNYKDDLFIYINYERL